MDKATSVGSNISYTLKVCAAISAVGILIKYGLNTNVASLVGLGLVGLVGLVVVPGPTRTSSDLLRLSRTS